MTTCAARPARDRLRRFSWRDSTYERESRGPTAVVVVVLVIAGWWLFRRSSRGPSIDLIATFDTATKKPATRRFPVIEAT